MESGENIKAFNCSFENLLKKIQINHIVCISDEIINAGWDFKRVEKYFAENSYHKIKVTTPIFLFSLENSAQKPQYIDDEVVNEFASFNNYIDKHIRMLCENGENLYEINEQIRVVIQKISKAVSLMNYESWLIEKDARNKDVIFLLIGKERRSYTELRFDLMTICKHNFDIAFFLRKNLLNEMKFALIELYSKYLLLPHQSKLPKIKYQCSKTDISELIHAISLETTIDENEQFKAILMGMFDISKDEYNNAIYYIRHREKGKSKFVKKLSDNIDNLKVPKK